MRKYPPLWPSIKSQSKVFQGIGTNTVKGFVVGLDKTANTAYKATVGMMQDIASTADGTNLSVGSSIFAGTGDIAGGIASGGGVAVHVGQLGVREEADVDRVAQQLYKLQLQQQRARGRY